MILLKIAGTILGAIVVLVLLYTLCLTVYYIIKNTLKIIKEAKADDRDREP